MRRFIGYSAPWRVSVYLPKIGYFRLMPLAEQLRIDVPDLLVGRKDRAGRQHALAKQISRSGNVVFLHSYEHTEKEYAALFAQAGFKLIRAIATQSPYSIVEGVSA